MTTFDQTTTRNAVKRFPVAFVRVSDGCPAGASTEAELETALQVLFCEGNTRVEISYPEA